MSDTLTPSLADFEFVQLASEFDLLNFECGEAVSDKDISNFLKDDSLNYQSHHLANTYLFKEGNLIAAYFCISNDCLNDKGENELLSIFWNAFHRKQKIPNQKRFRQYPSIKIGRLGVHTKYQGTGVAYQLMDFIKGFAILELKPACRLLLLDAVNQSRQIRYYDRNGFKFLLGNDEEDAKKDKRVMFYDLKVLA